MRNEAERYLKSAKNAKVINGSAENTGLDAVSIDCVTAAQAFTGLIKPLFPKNVKGS